MSPRPEEGLDNETNFFIQGENEKEELTDYKEDNSKVEGEQILDAIVYAREVERTYICQGAARCWWLRFHCVLTRRCNLVCSTCVKP